MKNLSLENKAIFVKMIFRSHPRFFIQIKFKIKIKVYFNGLTKTSQHISCYEINSSGYENQKMEISRFRLRLGKPVKLSAYGSWLVK